jgi:hypothetical protein
MNAARLKLVNRSVMRPVASKGRKANDAYRTREHLTEAEMPKLLAALKTNRHGHRDWLIGLLIYRHGLRVSEGLWGIIAFPGIGPPVEPPLCFDQIVKCSGHCGLCGVDRVLVLLLHTDAVLTL